MNTGRAGTDPAFQEEMEMNGNKQEVRTDRQISANAWRFQDSGSAEPMNSSFEKIFTAYNDYRNSQQWN